MYNYLSISFCFGTFRESGNLVCRNWFVLNLGEDDSVLLTLRIHRSVLFFSVELAFCGEVFDLTFVLQYFRFIPEIEEIKFFLQVSNP